MAAHRVDETVAGIGRDLRRGRKHKSRLNKELLMDLVLSESVSSSLESSAPQQL